MKRVWRTLLLSGLVTSLGYASLLMAGDGTAYRYWSNQLLRAASPEAGTRGAAVKPSSLTDNDTRVIAAAPEQSRSEPPVVLPQLVSPRFAEARDDTLPRPFSNTRDIAPATSNTTRIAPPESTSPAQRSRNPAVPAPTAEDARRRLASSIQSELKRVGCFTGEVDGEWDVATQRAMRDFNGRINASLPVGQPDYILLTLLQGHADRACTAGCPENQSQSGTADCQPRSTVASKPRQAAPAVPDRAAATVLPATRQDLATPVRPSAEVVIGNLDTTAARSAQPELRRSEPAPVAGTAPRRETDQQRIDREREQARLAAAVERRNKEAAERNAARQEAERLARLAEAERKRAQEEAKRLAALTVPAPAAAEPPNNAVARVPQSAGASAPEKQDEVRTEPALVVPIAIAQAPKAKPVKKAQQNARPRIASRPQPPPPYYVGRLPPRYVYWGPTYTTPPSRPRATVSRGSTRAIFPYLSRFSP